MSVNRLPNYVLVSPIQSGEVHDYKKLEFDHVVISNTAYAMETEIELFIRGQANVDAMHDWLEYTKNYRAGRFVMYIEPYRQECVVQIADTYVLSTDTDTHLNLGYHNHLVIKMKVQVYA